MVMTYETDEQEIAQIEEFYQQCVANMLAGTPKLVVWSWCAQVASTRPWLDADELFTEIQEQAAQ